MRYFREMVPTEPGRVPGRVATTGDSADLDAARAAYRRHAWDTARDALLAAREAPGFGAEDLYALANCSWWLGDLEAAMSTMQEAYQGFLLAEQPGSAALVALDLGYTFFLRGEVAQGSGWMGRGRRLLQDLPESAEHGYLLYIDFEEAFDASDLPRAVECAQRVQQMGARHDDPALTALGVLGQGRVALRQGNVAAGVALLDEAMVAAVSDDLDPGWAGNIYCHLMAACLEIADLRRAAEWTQATARWCERMPGAGPFLGICRVHRAQVLHIRGDWQRAEQEALRVCEENADFAVTTVAEAHYLLGELRRLRGDLPGAEEAFRAAHAHGRDPQPGLALLRLAQDRVDVALTSLRIALETAGADRLARGRLLPAAIEVFLAARDHDAAQAASGELADLAETYRSAALRAQALHGHGLLRLAEGDPKQAVAALRGAVHHWQEVDADQEVARVRTALARAYAELGDEDAAQREAAAAHAERQRMLAAWAGQRRRTPRPGGLTQREAEILAHAAEGLTNQQIAAELVLSVRTVERHLATVYQKLGVGGRSARAAAVSFALREGLAGAGAASVRVT